MQLMQPNAEATVHGIMTDLYEAIHIVREKP